MEARRRVRDNVERGADIIKTWLGLTLDDLLPEFLDLVEGASRLTAAGLRRITRMAIPTETRTPDEGSGTNAVSE